MLLRRSAGDLAAGALRCAQAFYGERDVHTAGVLIPPRKVKVDGVDEFAAGGWVDAGAGFRREDRGVGRG